VREYYQFFKGIGVGEVLEQEEVISKNKNMIVANHSPIPQPPRQTSREHHWVNSLRTWLRFAGYFKNQSSVKNLLFRPTPQGNFRKFNMQKPFYAEILHWKVLAGPNLIQYCSFEMNLVNMFKKEIVKLIKAAWFSKCSYLVVVMDSISNMKPITICNWRFKLDQLMNIIKTKKNPSRA